MPAAVSSRQTGRTGAQKQDGPPGDSGATERQKDLEAFECCICLDLAQEPVVTRCGHLYCWACFYKWMQTRPDCKWCPVCKAGTDEEHVTPIYSRGREPLDPRKANPRPSECAEDPPEASVPRRPPGQRAPAVDRSTLVVADPFFQAHGALHSLSTLFGLHSTSSAQEPLNQDQRRQAFLSKLLLMVGSLVLMALLLF